MGETPAERVLLAVAQAHPDPTLVLDSSVCVVWGNPAAEALFGISLEDGIGMCGLDLIHPDDLAAAIVSLESVQHKKVGTLLEMRVAAHDGWRLVELLGTTFGEDQFLMCLRDVTDRRRWEIATDGVERIRSLMHHATSITLLLTADGVIEASTGSLTRLLGQDQEGAEGRALAEVVDPSDRAALTAALAEVRDRPVGWQGSLGLDLRLCHSNGSTAPFALTFTNLLDDPTVGAIVVSGHDIADRVAAESELRAANSVLAATLEATTDGILVMGRDNFIIDRNTRFTELWHVDPEVVVRGAGGEVLEPLVQQLRDPGAFTALLVTVHENPTVETSDLVEFLDGRVLERESRPQRIDGVVVGRVWCFRDVTERLRLQDELAHRALHDPLTGLPNQALFRDRVAGAAARASRHDHSMAVMFVDLDDFKTVNDSLGHEAGDELLTTVARRLTACLRVEDTAARLGGDEFAVLVEGLRTPEQATEVADRILVSLRAPVELAGRSVIANASIGIAFGTAGSDCGELLRNADLAMYTAKSSGKSCHRTFADEMHRTALERLEIEARLRGAADRGELVVHYQPILELGSGRIHGFEALVRWEHPDRGFLAPGAFIPVAEDTELIDEIGRFVLATACREAVGWGDLAGPGLGDAPSISVNLAPRQLLDPDLPAQVAALLAQVGLPAHRLELELTEGALMRDPALAVERLHALHDLGVRLAVDDFGTGYSSLAYLRQFPIDTLKIDKTFVDDITTRPGASLARAIVELSRTLGLHTVAEGVEDQRQAEALRAFGCELAQGFHLGRPADLATTCRLVRDALPA